MIWSGNRIIEAQRAGEIVISPFSLDRVNPNSYNVRLGKQLAYHTNELDMKTEPKLKVFDIPDDGYLLKPGRLYLGITEEYTETHNAVPMIEGRSSSGRLGLFVHVTAGIGDVGFCGRWVLELMVVEPLKIYAGVEIAQIIYHEATDYAMSYGKKGQYQNTETIRPSGLWKEFN